MTNFISTTTAFWCFHVERFIKSINSAINLPSRGVSVDGFTCWSFLCAGLWKTSSSEQERSIGEPYVKNPRLIPRSRWYGMETGILVYSDSGAILKSFGILLMREGGGKSERRILATENGKSWAMLKLFLALLHLPASLFCQAFLYLSGQAQMDRSKCTWKCCLQLGLNCSSESLNRKKKALMIFTRLPFWKTK